MQSASRHSKRTVQFRTQVDSLLHGDSIAHLKTLKSDSIDLICTDPPYGIGFMGKAWDTFAPAYQRNMAKREATRRARADGRIATGFQDAAYAGSYDKSLSGRRAFQAFVHAVGKECLRVLKPGAFMFVTMTPRQDSLARVLIALEDAGFNIGFTSLYWTFASGFPKAMNISKAVDKRVGAARAIVGTRKQHDIRGNQYGSSASTMIETLRGGPASQEAKALDGAYGGFQPKPAVEVIIVAMKPLREKTFVDQALRNGKGITWLDHCRIPIESETVPRLNKANQRKGGRNFGDGEDGRLGSVTGHASSGRFPANLLVSDDILNDGRVTKGSSDVRCNKPSQNTSMHGANLGHVSFGHSDSGSYSRYFSLDAWTLTLPFLLVPKASKGEKDEGLDRFVPRQLHDRGCSRSSVIEKPPEHRRKNHHPTVKPLRLMQYLITLGSRPGDVVLDPFLGSGTTAVAAKSLGRRFIGIEREKDYLAIAQARIANAARVSPAPPAKSLKCASNPMRTTARPAPKPRSPAHSQ